MKKVAKVSGLDNVRVQKSGCLDFCENGISCVVYPECGWYTLSSEEDGAKIVECHLGNGEIVTELLMKLED